MHSGNLDQVVLARPPPMRSFPCDGASASIVTENSAFNAAKRAQREGMSQTDNNPLGPTPPFDEHGYRARRHL